MDMQIPKAQLLYKDDINEAVIEVQQLTGVEIDDEWWNANVGNNGTNEEILERFDVAYERDFGERIIAKQTEV